MVPAQAEVTEASDGVDEIEALFLEFNGTRPE